MSQMIRLNNINELDDIDDRFKSYSHFTAIRPFNLLLESKG